MKQKRCISTREVYKWKARLTIDGSKQVYGKHYDETYSPVVTWPATRFFLVQALINKWHTMQIDFVLAYTQAPIERELYMVIPKGIELEGENKGDYMLRLLRNLYGQKQAGREWSQHLVKGLQELGFRPSAVDECVFYHGNSILLLYVDDSILLGPESPHNSKRKLFTIEESGDLCDYLGIQIKREADGSIHLT
jgi:hypothetical protein